MSVDGTSTSGATPPSRSGLDLLTLNVNLIALLAALVFTVVGVKLTSFLPAKYYFSFAKVVQPDRTTPFLVGTPVYVSEKELGDRLEKNQDWKQKQCEAAVKEDESPDVADANSRACQEILEREIKNATQSSGDFVSNMIGFAVRLCIPLLVGFIIGRVFGRPGELAASVGAAMAAVLMCWPVVVLWNVAVTPDFKELYGQFMLLYLLNGVTFFYMAKVGAIFGGVISTRAPVLSLNFPKIIEASVIAIISGVGEKFVEHLVLKS
jgi:hypothetical protein